MATTRLLYRQLRPQLFSARVDQLRIAQAAAIQSQPFSTSPSRPATPQGPPPRSFRLPEQTRWHNDKESIMDRAGNYFMLTEIFRGMYVVLEQFFRPP